MRAAIQVVGHAVRQAAGHLNGHGGVVAHAGVQRAGAIGRRRAGAALRQPRLEDQLGELPSVERQFQYLLVRDDLSDARAARLDERRTSLNRHRLLDLADVERHRKRGVGADLQDDARLLVRPEPLDRRFEAVRPNRQVRQHIRPGTVRHGSTGEAGGGLGDGDRHARQRETALVLDGPIDLRGALGPCRRDRQQKDQ